MLSLHSRGINASTYQKYPVKVKVLTTDIRMTGVPQTIIFDLGKVIVDFDHMTFCRNASRYCPASPC